MIGYYDLLILIVLLLLFETDPVQRLVVVIVG